MGTAAAGEAQATGNSGSPAHTTGVTAGEARHGGGYRWQGGAARFLRGEQERLKGGLRGPGTGRGGLSPGRPTGRFATDAAEAGCRQVVRMGGRGRWARAGLIGGGGRSARDGTAWRMRGRSRDVRNAEEKERGVASAIHAIR